MMHYPSASASLQGHISEVESELWKILSALRATLPSEDLEEATDYVVHDECGIAIEHICTQIHEYDLKIPESLYDKIKYAAKLMNIDKLYYEDLPLQE